ncbi:MAG TPA: polyhydroxyalkanoate depolymerase [Pusillimonas sp.]|uniref:polyhydroxyalkanoate depolymerase n=1 Tax=unclassified Pusillimonas TaxID=2640016 RepID=UPI0026208C80|nr:MULTISPECIES: polyhydroxyalkanoate depolymerase [unclassified Pusillimonas]HLU20754.1 polyhydroxyalkanoate depolymerase [Pusillimonas sp.]
MLYDLHELQRSFLTPLSAFTDTGSQIFSHPYSPLAYTPFSRHIAAGYELIHRLGKDYEKPAWGLDSTQIEGKKVAVRERVVLHKPFCNLVHFHRRLPANRQSDPKVLLVAPLSGHHATLLRDTVRALLPAHDIYVTDWIDARMVPLNEGEFHLSDYVLYVREFIKHLGAGSHVIAVCQPTVPVLAAVSLMAADNDPSTPSSMVMMGGPIDPRESPTEVNMLATTKPYSWFEDNLIHRVPPRYPGAGRDVYPGFLQHAGFVAMNPQRHVSSHYDFYLDLIKGDNDDADAHRRFYDEYNAVLDMPAQFYLDTIRIVFQDYLLPRGAWEVDGRRVDPAAITHTALLTIEGELDDISGLGQTRAAHKLCSNIPADRKQHYMAAGAGHYGIFSGRRWRETICPKISTFIRRHQQA